MGKQTKIIEKELQVYITQSTAASIVYRLDVEKRLNFGQMIGTFCHRPIYLFNAVEKRRFHALKDFFCDTEKFIENCYRTAHEGGQNPDLVFPDGSPAYHLSLDCEFAHQDYTNVEIPAQIKDRGEAACVEFRNWFLQHKEKFETNPDGFSVDMSTAFDLHIHQLSKIIRSNSGVVRMNNENLNTIEADIDQLIGEFFVFYNQSEKHVQILDEFQHKSWLGPSPKPLGPNSTDFSDDEVKDVLREYRQKIITPLKNKVTTWLRVKYNPDLRFSGSLLEQLDLRPCRHCVGENVIR